MASPRFEFHQKIDSAFRAGFTAGYGAEKPHILRAVSGSDSQYFVTLVLQHFAGGHDRFFLWGISSYKAQAGKQKINNSGGEFPGQYTSFPLLPSRPSCAADSYHPARALLHDVMQTIWNV